jgi:hypothetical protein
MKKLERQRLDFILSAEKDWIIAIIMITAKSCLSKGTVSI